MEATGHIITILLAYIGFTSTVLIGVMGYFMRKIAEKLEKNDVDHHSFDLRLASGDEKLKKIDEHETWLGKHEERLNGHDKKFGELSPPRRSYKRRQ